MMKYFISIIFIIFIIPLYTCSATTLTSNGTGGGDWDDPNAWDGANTPANLTDGDTLVILATDTITLTSTESFNGIIQVYGTFHLNNGKLTMDASSAIQLAEGSVISAEHSGENEQITIGAGNKITSDDINLLITPNQLTAGSIEGGGCAVTMDCDDNPLPVEVIYFRAIELDNAIQLEWATSSEENFDYFTIERSSDGRIFYDHVKIFSGNPSSRAVRKYEYIDEMPYPGLSYYRLKATDFDGFFEYHGVVSANLEDAQPDILIYANPMVREWFTVSYNGDHESAFKVLNITGQIIEEGTVKPGLNEIQVPASMKSSIYFFLVDGLNTTIVKKFVIR